MDSKLPSSSVVTPADTGQPAAGLHGESATGTLWVGIDVGSTTVKAVAIEPTSGDVVFWRYLRHNACQAQAVHRLLKALHAELPGRSFETAACGSGAEPVVHALGGRFIQEVIATSIAVSFLHPGVRTAIELGGQDAKILFFDQDQSTGSSKLADMRMNGSCAGGTGAFIDQMAVLLGIGVEDFNELAIKGRRAHAISGRCGVFAKSDILPLINIGVPKEDLALSVFHAVASQVVCSLAQGIDIVTPVAFLGGPLSFNSALVRAFSEKLSLTDEEIVRPQHPQIMAAIGAALSIGAHRKAASATYLGPDLLARFINEHRTAGASAAGSASPFFADAAQRTAFLDRHRPPVFVPRIAYVNDTLEVYVGIDAGSTTLKVVLVDENGEIVDKFYAPNAGDSLRVGRDAMLAMWERYTARGVKLAVKGLGVTGYGENLFARALGADFHTVETIAHACAALTFVPDATFVLDIGGQDMKAMRVEDGVISNVYLNEACSSGCGSFIETLTRSLGIPLDSIASTAFAADHPVALGSRCTVFMLSSVTTEQKNGRSVPDIVAGLCRSVVENVFSKVIRVSNVKALGDKIVVQGGTFKNDAVLRAFEQHIGIPVFRAPHCGEMGAYGAAVLAKRALASVGDGRASTSRFIGFEALRHLSFSNAVQETCPGCENHCKRTVVRFSTGTIFCSGNRCSRGDVSVSMDALDVASDTRQRPAAKSLLALRERLLLGKGIATTPTRPTTIGIPLVMEFWNSLPFWRTLFESLGFPVVVSGRSTAALAAKGNRFAVSDSICFPAKLLHGHIEALIDKNVDRIFVPSIRGLPGGQGAAPVGAMCPIVQGVPLMVRELSRPHERSACVVDSPVFAWDSSSMRNKQIRSFLSDRYGVHPRAIKRAIGCADRALADFNRALSATSTAMLAELEKSGGIGIALLGRPYHADSLVNHGIPEIFTSRGIPVFTADTLPGVDGIDLSCVRPELYNPMHSSLYRAAIAAARHPNLEVVHLVSFGCGHDAIIADEVERIMRGLGAKSPLVLKVDDSDSAGALSIRIRSFVDTVEQRRLRTC